MVYITGDIHGQTERIIYYADRFGMTEEDVIVILGDVGANYYLNKRDKETKEKLSSIKLKSQLKTDTWIPVISYLSDNGRLKMPILKPTWKHCVNIIAIMVILM
jgi:Icc-related predicted phosphoesterase